MITATLAVLLVAVLVLFSLAVYGITQRDETIRFQNAVIRGMRRRIAHQEELLAGTERAVEVAREVLGLPDESTPIHDLLAEEREQHEAQVLQFKRDLDGWGTA